LDEDARSTLADALTRLRGEARTTLVVVSHDVDPAVDIVDRVVTLDAGTLIDDAPANHPAIVDRQRRS